MKKLGPYQIVGELGRGGMGTVYRGLDPVIGRPVAIKTVRLAEVADRAEQSILRDRLYREAQSAGILSHPGIVTIYHIGEEGGVTFIAMEFIDGPTLGAVLAEGSLLDRGRARDILRQVAAALDYAHRNGVVHRDIKPANLMLTSDWRVKVADFGVAKIASSTLTRTGVTLGSPSYMSPEQVQAVSLDGRSDQYSLAVVACEILGGQKPFIADTFAALAYKIVHAEPDLDGLAATAGTGAVAVLRKALSKDPGRRYASCSEFVEALGAALDQPAVAVAARPSRRLPAWALSTGVTLALIAGGAGGVKLWRESRPEATQAAPSLPAMPPAQVIPLQETPPAPVTRPPEPRNDPPPRPPVSAKAASKPAAPSRRVAAEPAPAVTEPEVTRVSTVPPSAPPPKPEPAPPPVVEPQPASVAAAPPSAPPARTPPVLLFQTPAAYTEEARRAGVQGEVLLSVEVDERGTPSRMEVVRSLDRGLDQKAMDAVRRWRFRPALSGGSPVPAQVQVEVKFRLANAPSPGSPSLKRPPGSR